MKDVKKGYLVLLKEGEIRGFPEWAKGAVSLVSYSSPSYEEIKVKSPGGVDTNFFPSEIVKLR